MTLSITSKGKYEISFKFTLEDAYGKPYKENLDDLFKIMPQQGTLIPVDRPTQVQVMFKSHSEINIQELPILKCHVIEPNMSETGETIASIPIKITGSFQNPGKLIQIFYRNFNFPVGDSDRTGKPIHHFSKFQLLGLGTV